MADTSPMHPVKRELWRLLGGVALVALALLAAYLVMDAQLQSMRRTQERFHASALNMGAELSSVLASMQFPPGVAAGAAERVDDEVGFVSSVTRNFGRAQFLLNSLIALHKRESAPEFERTEQRLERARDELEALDRTCSGDPLALARVVSLRPVYATTVVQQTQRLHEQASRNLQERRAAAQRLFTWAYVVLFATLGFGLAWQLRRSLRGIDGILEKERHARERAGAVLAAVPDLWFVLDEVGRFLEISNPTHPDLDTPWERLKGKAFAPVPAASLLSDDGFVPGSLPRATGLEYEVAPDDRGARAFEARLVPTSKGQWLYLSRDISERKRAELGMAQTNEELERQVASRTVQLSAARDAAESANRAKSDFLSRMSHELRTPMNGVLGFAQLLGLDSSLSARHRQSLNHILRSGKLLLHLINDVLDLAHVESGRLTFSLEPLSVEEVVNDVVALMGPLAQSHRVRLQVMPMSGTVVRGDRLRVKQVLLNLTSNAIKYNRPEGWVRFHADALVAGRVRIVVEDSGQGIMESDQTKAFEPFARLGAERSGIEGTGIGLSISKRLIELMGGRIGVESSPGKGSSFWVELPWDQLSPDADAPRLTVDYSPDLLQLSRVLYVEDNTDNLALVAHIIERHPNIQFISAPSATLGFDLARSHRPDLILLDIQLPDIDGYALLKMLRANEATRLIPAVAVTANAMSQDEMRAREAGFAAYISKPIDVRKFDAMLRDLLGHLA